MGGFQRHADGSDTSAMAGLTLCLTVPGEADWMQDVAVTSSHDPARCPCSSPYSSTPDLLVLWDQV